MQDDPNKDNPTEHPEPLETQDWELALEPYKGNPGSALSLGFNLCANELSRS